MTVTAPAQPAVYTAADLERLSDEGHHYELIQGELREMALRGGTHGSTSSRIAYYGGTVYEQDLGETFAAETGFLVSRNPDTVLAPDFAFVAKDRLPGPLPEGYVPLAPDLVVETTQPARLRGRWKNGWRRGCGCCGSLNPAGARSRPMARGVRRRF